MNNTATSRAPAVLRRLARAAAEDGHPVHLRVSVTASGEVELVRRTGCDVGGVRRTDVALATWVRAARRHAGPRRAATVGSRV